jgi:hypothetical protein
METKEQSTWAPPKTINEAEQQRASLIEKVLDIQGQLSSRDMCHPDGLRMTEFEYHRWRHKAVFALTKTQAELSKLKAWIRTKNQEFDRRQVDASGVDSDDPVDLLVALYGLVAMLCREGVALNSPEQALRNRVREYLLSVSAIEGDPSET